MLTALAGAAAAAAPAPARPAASAAGARLDSLVGSVRFVVEGGEPAVAAAARCREALRRRAATLAAALLPPGAVPRPVVCHVLPTDAFRERFAGGVPDWGLAVALRGGRVIAIDWRRQGANRRPLEEVFCHELAHAWLEQATGGAAVPTWFHEGVALRLSGEWRFIDTVELMLEGRPPPLRRLDGPFPDPAGWADQAYRVSLRAILALEKRYGRDVIARLAAATRAGGDFDAAFELATGAALDAFVTEFDAGWRRGLGWLFTLTRWPGLFILLGLAFLGAGAARRLRLRRLASLEDD